MRYYTLMDPQWIISIRRTIWYLVLFLSWRHTYCSEISNKKGVFPTFDFIPRRQLPIHHCVLAMVMKTCRVNFIKILSFVQFHFYSCLLYTHYGDVIMGAIASQITSLTIVYSTVYSDVDQRKHQSSASLAFVRGIHRRPVNSPHKWPVKRKIFPFDDVIMFCQLLSTIW